jgi:hypothetical protein
VRRAELAFDRLGAVALGEEQVAVQPREAAIQSFVLHDRLDPVDRSGMTCGRVARGIAAAQLFQLEIAVVQHADQVPGAGLRHAAARLAVVEQRDRLAGTGELVRDAQAGDAGADDAYVDVQVFLQRGK